MCPEYQSMPGEFVCAEESEFGWAVVSKHSASEQDGYWPGNEAPGEVRQEWRELRLATVKEGGGTPGVSDGTGQSVVKVSLCEGADPVQVPYCCALGYTKSMLALALAGEHVQGSLPLDPAEMGSMRALVVGLGAGSMPLWLTHSFPRAKMIVDALEIDPAVVSVATGALGLPKGALRPGAGDAAAAAADALAGGAGEALRIYEVGGEDFVEAMAKQGPAGCMYDMVFVDAFDKNGKVPPVLVDPEGPFLKALPSLLAPKATIVLNLLVGLSGSGSSGGPAEVEAMVSAISQTCCLPDSEVFNVRTPMNESSGNLLYGFLRAGRPEGRGSALKESLRQSAEAVNKGFPADTQGNALRFDLGRRVVFAYNDWAPGGSEVATAKKGAFSLFG